MQSSSAKSGIVARALKKGSNVSKLSLLIAKPLRNLMADPLADRTAFLRLFFLPRAALYQAGKVLHGLLGNVVGYGELGFLNKEIAFNHL